MVENIVLGSQKLKIRLPYDLSISTPEYIKKKKKIKNTNPKDTCTQCS